MASLFFSRFSTRYMPLFFPVFLVVQAAPQSQLLSDQAPECLRVHGLSGATTFERIPSVRPEEAETDDSSLLQLQWISSASLGALVTRVNDRVDAILQRHYKSTNNTVGGQVLFVVLSDSNFYKTRIKWLLDTWASSLVPADLVVVGDRLPATEDERAATGRATFHESACQGHSHWEGLCCKYGEAAVLIAAFMDKYPNYEWVYSVDDDVYVRPDAVRRYLAGQAPTKAGAPGRVLGTFGCHSEHCHEGFCGSGGYAADHSAMTSLVSSARGGATSLLEEQMANCKLCSLWGDLALGEVFYARKLDMRTYKGVHGNRMTKPCWDNELADTSKEPLEFHYIKTESQMSLLHNLFTGTTPTSSNSTVPANCVTFNKRTVCADTPDTPWDASTSATCWGLMTHRHWSCTTCDPPPWPSMHWRCAGHASRCPCVCVSPVSPRRSGDSGILPVLASISSTGVNSTSGRNAGLPRARPFGCRVSFAEIEQVVLRTPHHVLRAGSTCRAGWFQ